MPEHLLAKPYLRPVYDHPQFILRNIWRLYGGWYDGEPDNLLPAPRAEQAREWVSLAGGVEKVLARVRELRTKATCGSRATSSSTRCSPSRVEGSARRCAREIYAARSKEQESSMARNILNHAALARSRESGIWRGGVSRCLPRTAGRHRPRFRALQLRRRRVRWRTSPGCSGWYCTSSLVGAPGCVCTS